MSFWVSLLKVKNFQNIEAECLHNSCLSKHSPCLRHSKIVGVCTEDVLPTRCWKFPTPPPFVVGSWCGIRGINFQRFDKCSLDSSVLFSPIFLSFLLFNSFQPVLSPFFTPALILRSASHAHFRSGCLPFACFCFLLVSLIRFLLVFFSPFDFHILTLLQF